MHPAYSVIFFTTASGAGYGLLALAGLLAITGILPADRGFALTVSGLGLGLVSAGLLASTAHLGHPERAWRAFSQWRTSWLSREGVVAVATYIPAGLFALGWGWLGRVDGAFALAGGLTVLGAIATVGCTAMIYASLKPIPRWRHGLVPPIYLALGAMTGGVCLYALARCFGLASGTGAAWAVAGLILGAGLKLLYWHSIDHAAPIATTASATGLVGKGPVRLLDAPHTEANYLMKEMGFRIARKHASSLRRLTLGLGFGLPLALLLPGVWLTNPGVALAAVLASLIMFAGVLIERWLFFAEAKHTVMLYYGADAV